MTLGEDAKEEQLGRQIIELEDKLSDLKQLQNELFEILAVDGIDQMQVDKVNSQLDILSYKIIDVRIEIATLRREQLG